MKVLHIINSLNTGGAEKLILDSIPLYQKKGIEVDVMCLKNSKSYFKEKLNLNSSGKVFSLTDGSVYNPFLIFKIFSYLRKYDLVHIHLFPALYWVVLAKCISNSKVKLIYTEHSTSNRRRSHWLMKRLDKFIYSKLDFVGCISPAVYDNLCKHLGKNDKFNIIYNGLNLKDYIIKDNELVSRFFNTDDKVLIQVSSFRIQKDQETLIDSLSLLPEYFKLVLVGEGPLRKLREEQVERLGLEKRVLFLGIRNDIPLLLAGADIIILSSNYEGFGLAIVEGMAANKPVIASDVDGLKNIVHSYGLLFKRGDSKDLVIKINSLFENETFYKEVQKACLLRANDFDIETMVDSYIAEYKNVLQ